jgi:hypothetical protein
MAQHRLREIDRLEFIDQYPRTTMRLPASAFALHDSGELGKYLENELAALPGPADASH